MAEVAGFFPSDINVTRCYRAQRDAQSPLPTVQTRHWSIPCRIVEGGLR